MQCEDQVMVSYDLEILAKSVTCVKLALYGDGVVEKHWLAQYLDHPGYVGDLCQENMHWWFAEYVVYIENTSVHYSGPASGISSMPAESVTCVKLGFWSVRKIEINDIVQSWLSL